MKALFWTDGFWPRTGGIETQGYQFIKGMQQRGHHYRVIAQRDSVNDQEHELYDGISIRRFDFNRVEDFRTLRVLQTEVQRILDEFQPDCIHLFASSGLSVFVFLLIKEIFRVPIIATLHTPYFYKGLNPILEPILKISDRVFCVSKWVLEQTKSLAPQTSLELIYNGLPHPKITPTLLSLSPSVLLVMGRLAPEKGFDTAIRAFSLLKKGGSEARLVIVGGGPERSTLEHLAAELKLTDTIYFTGELKREEGLHWINRASMILVPSYFEPFGLVALEAMLMKRPVIASRVGGLEEIVLDGETGILIPPADPIALSRAIQTLIDQPVLAIQMGVNGYKRASERFTLEQNLIAYEGLMGRLPIASH